jgi:hypothetical protein
VKRRFYHSASSIHRAVAGLLHRDGSPQAALDAIRPALARMQSRMQRLANSAEHDAAIRQDGMRYGWRIDVRIALLQLERLLAGGVR